MYNDLKGGKGVKLINGFGGFDKLGGKESENYRPPPHLLAI